MQAKRCSVSYLICTKYFTLMGKVCKAGKLNGKSKVWKCLSTLAKNWTDLFESCFLLAVESTFGIRHVGVVSLRDSSATYSVPLQDGPCISLCLGSWVVWEVNYNLLFLSSFCFLRGSCPLLLVSPLTLDLWKHYTFFQPKFRCFEIETTIVV